jgi:hypothetical protein
VRDDLEALIAHAGSGSRLRAVPARPAELALRALELARVSPLAEWHYRTAHKDSFVSIDKARRLLGWEPRLSNEETLCSTYDWYLAHRERLGATGTTHRVPWSQGALGLLRRLSCGERRGGSRPAGYGATLPAAACVARSSARSCSDCSRSPPSRAPRTRASSSATSTSATSRCG